MDVKKLYTPLEAATLYNVAKIKFDPTSYSLRGNLIFGDVRDVQKEHIVQFSWDAEEHLTELLKNGDSRTVYPYEGPSKVRGGPRNGSLWGYFLAQQDNLHVAIDLLNKYVDLDKIKTTNVVDTIVAMCVALNSPKSCAKDMLWLTLDDTRSAKYSQVHNFELLKDALAKPRALVPLVLERISVDCTYVPAECDYECGRSEPYKTDMYTGVDSMYGHLVNAFEVLWAWSKLSPEHQRCFVELCKNAEHGPFTMSFFKDVVVLTGSGFVMHPDVQSAIVLESPEERYEAYQKIISTSPNMLKYCEEFYHNNILKKQFVNSIFIAFTAFVGQLSLANIRVNQIRILYEYCKAKGFPISKPSMGGGIPLGKFGSVMETSKSLMDFTETSYGDDDDDDDDWEEDDDKLSKPDGTSHDESAMFEALDKLKADFSSGGYSFTVHDVVDKSPANKTKYDAIATKVDLVNKLLIRKIRDIKTYNVGGKRPGMPSGRIDRKALYRYKYDSNIFYNNTYKTLESDLAFGIILDESGSMSGKGIENGRITMIVLHETLKALGINHCIIGHTSDGKHHSEIARYQSFREDKTYNTCKNYALVTTEAKDGNCDSGALYYMEKALDRVRNRDKICLIFSDGAPTECTGTELKQQVKRMEKKGIKVIGIGINFASIAKYYTDYANGRNLTDMLNIVAKILEEYVLKKKDK